jgi:hypothetical protein
MPNTCDHADYKCGSLTWPTGSNTRDSLVQDRDNHRYFNLGTTVIDVVKQKRTFTINTSSQVTITGFLMKDVDDNPFLCGDSKTVNQNSISENHQYTTTILYFLDTRYNNAFGKEIIEIQTFDDAGGNMAGFKETFGIQYLPKFVITNHKITTTINYFVVLNGVKTILKTTTETVNINSPVFPLIIVWPLPQGEAIPWINVDDIKQFGFYDYHNADDGSAMIQRDGGDDFYYTDWMRMIGQANAAEDTLDAQDRYLNYYLSTLLSGSGKSSYGNPGILTDTLPRGSIAQDTAGNIFYSMLMGGVNFNSLTGGDLVKLFPDLGANARFYPVGLI